MGYGSDEGVDILGVSASAGGGALRSMRSHGFAEAMESHCVFHCAPHSSHRTAPANLPRRLFELQ